MNILVPERSKILLRKRDCYDVINQANFQNLSFLNVLRNRSLRWRKWGKFFSPDRLCLLTTDKVSYPAQGTALTWTLNSLAASTTVGRQATPVSNTVNLDDEIVGTAIIKTSASAIGSSKAVYIYVSGSFDGSNYDQDDAPIGAADAGYTINSPSNLRLARVGNCPTSSEVYNVTFPIGLLWGNVVPPSWVPVLCNDTNQALASTGNSGNYTRIQWTNS